MAIDISDLTSFYSSELFQSGNNSVILKEKQQNAGSLSSVEILTPGEYILIKPGFLNESKEAYRKIDKHISYRDINDGTLLVEYKGKRYLVYIELKSGYNGVCSKAIYQLPVSSIKIKSYLRNFASYTPGEYEEVGLIVSFPPKQIKPDMPHCRTMPKTNSTRDSANTVWSMQMHPTTLLLTSPDFMSI